MGQIEHMSWCNILICRCMQKHIQHNKDERTQFFRKNIPLTLFERVLKSYERYYLWEVSWRLNRTATYWHPTLLATAAFLSRSPGLLNWGPLLGHGSHSSIVSPTDLNFLSPGLYNNLTSAYFLRASQFVLSSTLRQSRLSPDIFDRMHLLFTQVHFFFWQLDRGQYVTLGMALFCIWWWGSNLGALRNVKLQLLPGPRWLGVVVHVRVPYKRQIELFINFKLNY